MRTQWQKVVLFFLLSIFINTSFAMGLRSLVALPVDKGGTVLRLAMMGTEESGRETLTTALAYGINAQHTLLMGLPYRLSSATNSSQKNNRLEDMSVLYRHLVFQQDSWGGTNRFGLLGGALIPTEQDNESAVQSGFVFTHFKHRHEIDIDAVYQAGQKDRLDSGRFDISWQYRLSPSMYPEWGIPQQINSIVELNGRWLQGQDTTRQITLGLQWIDSSWVIEGGLVKDINNNKQRHYVISTRFHF